MMRTKFRDLTIEDVTPKNCKRKQLKVYQTRPKTFIGFVSWDSHRRQYYMKLSDHWEWSGGAFRNFGALLDCVNMEHGK